MPQVKPFKALLYSKELADQCGELISPPYDVINSEDRKALIEKNKLNSVQLCLAEDPKASDCYQKMKERFENWKKEGVLKKADQPAFYLVEDEFEIGGKTRKRIGYVGLLKTTPFETKEVLPHEHTLKGPKRDRLALLETMGAELSQIFMCYQDESQTLEKIHQKHSSENPYFDAVDCMGVRRRLWLIDDPKEVQAISEMMESKPVLIADGHHRYETAIEFSKRQPKLGEYVQVYFTNQLSPGFGILPIHRVTDLPEDFTMEDFYGKLRSEYELTECPREGLEDRLQSGDPSKLKLGLVSSGKAEAHILSKTKASDLDAEIFVLQNEIFEGVFGWKIEDVSKDKVAFDHRAPEIFKIVDGGDRKIGFILPPTDLNLVMEVSQKGERMPQKSTFFYPKLASGLVNYELESH